MLLCRGLSLLLSLLFGPLEGSFLLEAVQLSLPLVTVTWRSSKGRRPSLTMLLPLAVPPGGTHEVPIPAAIMDDGDDDIIAVLNIA